MRISAEPNDPAYLKDTSGYVVYFNDELIRHAFTADSDAGYLRAAVLCNGVPALVGGEVELRDYFGEVRIEWGHI